ncbi:MAG: hypothetical protein IKS96_07030 [Fibrobacter sp.]|nr:hypothetical protein [Fibrobacter sp.]MBR6449681.1 hypothetical protein [Fibrobacter sp.]
MPLAGDTGNQMRDFVVFTCIGATLKSGAGVGTFCHNRTSKHQYLGHRHRTELDSHELTIGCRVKGKTMRVTRPERRAQNCISLRARKTLSPTKRRLPAVNCI